MIEKTITFVEDRLNLVLKNKLNLQENVVIAANPVNRKGEVESANDNRIILSLIDIEPEKFMKKLPSFRQPDTGTTAVIQPQIPLNLLLLFASNYDANKYKQGLKLLSEIVSYFQKNGIYSPSNSPELSSMGIQKITMEMYHPDSESRNSIWSSLGMNYVPSVMYKLRVKADDENQMKIIVSDIASNTVPGIKSE